MQVIPVIDLQRGSVVRAVRGRRASYRPLKTVFDVASTPAAIAELCVTRLSLSRLYVADLDAIEGASVDWNSLAQVAASGATFMVDAGLTDTRRAEQLMGWHAWHACFDGVIVGLESSRDTDSWADLVRILTVERAIFSLDLRSGIPVTGCPKLVGVAPEEIARRAYQAGFRRVIVLDLAAVGAGEGPITLDLCRAVRERDDWAELISGGAVRHAGDLVSLQHAGCDAALVASALYDGRLDSAPEG